MGGAVFLGVIDMEFALGGIGGRVMLDRRKTMTKWTRETWWILYGHDVKDGILIVAFVAFILGLDYVL